MNNQIGSNKSAQELQKTLSTHLTQLAQETNNALTSKEMSLYLDFCARFYQYSANNVWLILLQRPSASHVAGYHSWQKMGRYVMRGEKSIEILAPLIIKQVDSDGKEKNRLVGFKVCHVFDQNQTSGSPLPSLPIWKSPQQNNELRQKLMDFAKRKGIQITYEEFKNEMQGMSLGGKIVLSPSSGVKTLAHEICHEILHHGGGEKLSHMERELEAESAAYIICSHFGLSGLSSPNYVALQGASGDLILQHFQRILNTAAEIIKAISIDSCPS